MRINLLTENDFMYSEQIPGCKINMNRHQLILLYKCIEHENNGICIKHNESYANSTTDMGIIADKVGSGKSYVILALITCNHCPSNNHKTIKSFGFGHFILESRNTDMIDKDLNMLVVPHMLVKQWENSIKSFSDMSYYIINTSKNLDDFENKISNLPPNTLLLVSGTFYKYVSYRFNNNKWRVKRIFFDEADSMKVPASVSVNSKFYWFVTASYNNLIDPHGYYQYSRRDLDLVNFHNGVLQNKFIKDLFSNLKERLNSDQLTIFSNIIMKNRDSFVDSSLQLVDPVKNVIRCKSPLSVNVLRGLVRTDIINSLNAGDIKGAIEYINPHNVSSEQNIIAHVLRDLRNQFTNTKIQYDAAQISIYDNEYTKTTTLTRIQTHMDEINDKIHLMTNRIQENDMCVICYNEFDNKTVVNCCKNCYCFKCISIWLSSNQKCPLCKANIDLKNDIFVIDNTGNFTPSNKQYNTEHFNKFENLEQLINKIKTKNTSAKLLIFSEFENSFLNMYAYLENTGITYNHIKGNSNMINSTIKKYRESNLDSLLVNSKNYGSGMNLENTTDVILFHKFERQIEQQIIGRAQRPGRTTPLNIWYLLNSTEV